jgi:hypothetical protein
MRGWPSMIGVFWPMLRTVTLDKATFRDARVRADYAAGKYGFPEAHPSRQAGPDPATGRQPQLPPHQRTGEMIPDERPL